MDIVHADLSGTYTIKRYICTHGHIRDGQDIVIHRPGQDPVALCGECLAVMLPAIGVGTLSYHDEVEREWT